MCIVCVEFSKGKMTGREALRALREQASTQGEYSEELEHTIGAMNDIAERAAEQMHAAEDDLT